jgi:hypothetical protein
MSFYYLPLLSSTCWVNLLTEGAFLPGMISSIVLPKRVRERKAVGCKILSGYYYKGGNCM